jgi:hypothetical protein
MSFTRRTCIDRAHVVKGSVDFFNILGKFGAFVAPFSV